jgi:hypothetical protein
LCFASSFFASPSCGRLLEIRAEPLALGQAWAFQSLSLSHQTPLQLSGLFHAGKEEKQARVKYIK